MKDRAIGKGWAPRDGVALKLWRMRGFVIRFLPLAVCGGLVSACAVSVPMGGATDDLATGTVRHQASLSPFSAEMDAEDWRRAKSALDTALDPQGNGASVAWENPTSGAKGSFVPLAQPYPKDDGICRPFRAHVAMKGQPERVVRSSACRVNSGDWIVGRVQAITGGEAAPNKSDNLADREPRSHLT